MRKKRRKATKTPTLMSFLSRVDKEIKARYNKATGWLSVEFPAKPSQDVLSGLKLRGFRWKPRAKRWSGKWTIEREDYAKKLAGLVKKIDIKPDWAKKAGYAKTQFLKHQKESNARFDRTWKSMKTIPIGQPILIGHHSERAHRSHLRRIDKGFEIARRETAIAEKYQARAKRYKRKATGESPGLIHRRIEKLEASKRKMERELQIGKSGTDTIYYSGKISAKRKQEIHKWLSHYNERLKIERAKYKASGGIATDKIQFKKGDRVRTSVGAATIVKVNPKTITITTQAGHIKDWRLKLKKSQIYGKVK